MAVVILNYAIIGVPLYKKSASIDMQSKAILIKQVKSGNVLKGGSDEFLLELFRKEKASIERKFLFLNCAAISLAIVIASWTVFGVIFHKNR